MTEYRNSITHYQDYKKNDSEIAKDDPTPYGNITVHTKDGIPTVITVNRITCYSIAKMLNNDKRFISLFDVKKEIRHVFDKEDIRSVAAEPFVKENIEGE